MIIVKLIEFFRQRMKATITACYAVLAFLVALDLFFKFTSHEYVHHQHTLMEKIPGWWSLYGFIACVLIIIVSKWYGHLGIMTREDYYDD